MTSPVGANAAPLGSLRSMRPPLVAACAVLNVSLTKRRADGSTKLVKWCMGLRCTTHESTTTEHVADSLVPPQSLSVPCIRVCARMRAVPENRACVTVSLRASKRVYIHTRPHYPSQPSTACSTPCAHLVSRSRSQTSICSASLSPQALACPMPQRASWYVAFWTKPCSLLSTTAFAAASTVQAVAPASAREV